jgi:hypothetical protein
MTKAVDRIVADLEQNPPTALTEARTKLQDLLAALRGSIEEKFGGIKAESPDYQAVLSEMSVRVEAVEAVTAAIADLMKAEATAAAALERTWKKLHAARTEQRVWRKLKAPAAT